MSSLESTVESYESTMSPLWTHVSPWTWQLQEELNLKLIAKQHFWPTKTCGYEMAAATALANSELCFVGLFQVSAENVHKFFYISCRPTIIRYTHALFVANYLVAQKSAAMVENLTVSSL